MSAEGLHEVQFSWPHPEPNTVIVTGTFDDWSSSIYLTKTPAGFEGTTKIRWGEKIKFKYIVDGKWIVHEDQPTEVDPGGFVNNVYNAPPHPSNAEVAEPVIEDVQPTTNGHLANGHTLVAKIVENPAGVPEGESAADDKPIEDLAKAEDKVVADSEHQGTDIPPPGFPQLLSDLANTIVARDGTSSALDYVASGLGAVMHGVVGVDPINIQKIAIPTPVSDEEGFILPRGQESVPVIAVIAPDSVSPAADPDTPMSRFAPRVPIAIVPVNAAENNTASPSSPAVEINSPIPIIEAGPAVVVTEPSPTPPASPHMKSEAIFAPVVEADAQPSAAVKQEQSIKAEMPSEDTLGKPVLLEVDSVATPEPGSFSPSEGPQPILSVIGPEPVRAATESVAVPVLAVEPETTTATEATPATEAGVPAATKAQPEFSSTATESIAEPEADKLVVEANIVEDEIPAPVVGLTSPVAVNENLAPEPNPPTGSLVDATAVEQANVTDKGKKVTGVGYAATTEPAVQEQVADAKLQEPSASELKPNEVVGPTPTAVVTAVEAREPPAVNEPMTTEPSPVVDEVTLTKEHGQANGSTTTDPSARISTNGHEALSTATTSTPEAVTHAEKFPSASASHPVSEDNTPSSSKFNSTRKKRASIFGKLKNIFHQDKEKEKK